MNDTDQHLLWEAYLEKHTHGHKDDDNNEKKKSNYDDGDNDDEKCDYVPCKEGTDGSTSDLTEREKIKLAAHAAKTGKGPLATEEIYGAEGAEEGDEDVQEEDNGLYTEGEEVGLDSIHDAIRNLDGHESDDGDWEGAIKQVMSGLAERVIHHAKEGNGGVIGDPDLADRWDFKTGVKDAIVDLLDSQTYDDLSAGFKKAFHRAKQDEDSGRFDFSNNALLAKMKANSEHDDEPRYHPRERENQDLNDLGL